MQKRYLEISVEFNILWLLTKKKYMLLHYIFTCMTLYVFDVYVHGLHGLTNRIIILTMTLLITSIQQCNLGI